MGENTNFERLRSCLFSLVRSGLQYLKTCRNIGVTQRRVNIVTQHRVNIVTQHRVNIVTQHRHSTLRQHRHTTLRNIVAKRRVNIVTQTCCGTNIDTDTHHLTVTLRWRKRYILCFCDTNVMFYVLVAQMHCFCYGGTNVIFYVLVTQPLYFM